jgi:hypothetical protein
MKKVRKNFTWIKLLTVGLLFLGIEGCTEDKQTSFVYRSFELEEPCAPPCWYDLRINESTEAEVLRVLESLPFIDASSIRISKVNPSWLEEEDVIDISSSCTQGERGDCVSFMIASDQLVNIWLRVDYKLTYGDIIAKLGPPSAAYCAAFTGPGSVFVMPWPEKNIIAKEYIKSGCPEGIDLFPPDRRVSAIEYVDSRWFSFPDNSAQLSP